MENINNEAVRGAVGKTIASVALDNDELVLRFTDGTGIKLVDEGQSCCEYRYMRTDDILTDYIGAEFRGAEIKDAPEVDDGCTVHEVQFLEVQTSKGVFTMSSHNEHNGYYGGFWITATNLS